MKTPLPPFPRKAPAPALLEWVLLATVLGILASMAYAAFSRPEPLHVQPKPPPMSARR